MSSELTKLNFRATDVTVKQLKSLQKLWGENLSLTIRRAISVAFETSVDKNKKKKH